MRFRGKSIRRKIVALLLVPLASLTGLWVFATYVTGREAGELMGASAIVEQVGHPLEDTIRAVQGERRQTLVFLADPRASDALPLLRRRRAVTDRVVADVRQSARSTDVRDKLSPDSEAQLDSILGEIDGLDALRGSVERRTIDRTRALAFYNGLVDPCYRFLNGLHTMENVSMDKQVRALVGISRAREMLSREDALIASGLIAGRLGAPELRVVSDLAASRKLLYEVNLELLLLPVNARAWSSTGAAPTPNRSGRRSRSSSPRGRSPSRAPSTPRAGRKSPRRSWSAWPTTAPRCPTASRTARNPCGYRVLIRAGGAGVLGFVALLVSVFVSVRVGRELVRDLSRLRKDAHEVSGVRLPSVMRRLAAGEQVDVETEAPTSATSATRSAR